MSSIAELAAGSRRRLEVRRADRDQRAIELTEVERWARDPLGWIRAHVVIASKFSEGAVARVRPVRMASVWPDQEQTIREWIDLDELERSGELVFGNVLIEKSRQIGETWVLAAIVAWLLNYHATRGLFMHTRAAEVADRGWSIDSFFGKVKYIQARLELDGRAPGIRPLTFRPFSTDPASIENPATGSFVRGECQRDDPGRGSTFDWAIVDEAAHVPHGEQVHAAIDEACAAGKLYLSTPEGSGNMHARMCDERPAGWTYLRLHWSSHPVYGAGAHVAGEQPDCTLCEGNRAGVEWVASNPQAHRYPGNLTSPWYDQAVVGKTDEQVASELDIDRERSLSGRVYPEFQRALHVVEDGIAYDPALPVQFAWDFGLDCTSVPVIQDSPEEVRVIGLLEMGDLFATTATPETVSAGLRAYLLELGVPPELCSAEATARMRSIGDPAGQARSLSSALPYVDQYRARGFLIERPSTRMTARVDFSIVSVKRLLAGTPKPLRVCGRNAREFANHMAGNRWRTDARGIPTQPRALLDDEHNHCARAFAYWAVATYPPDMRGGPVRMGSPARARVAAPRKVPVR